MKKRNRVNVASQRQFFSLKAVPTCPKYILVLLRISVSHFHFQQMKKVAVNLPSLRKCMYCSFFPSCSYDTDLHSHQNKHYLTDIYMLFQILWASPAVLLPLSRTVQLDYLLLITSMRHNCTMKRVASLAIYPKAEKK